MDKMVSLLGKSYPLVDRGPVVPEVSTMVVFRLLFNSGGIVIGGTIVWIFDMNVSFTKDVMSQGSQMQRAQWGVR